MTAHPARQGVSWRVVGVGFGGLLLVGLAVAVFIYFSFIQYERVVALHLPADTTAAIRVDVEQAILYEPFRKHLLPLVNEGKGERGGAVLSPRVERIQSKTRIELGVDLRELVLVRGGSWADWLIIAGGKFPKSGVVPGLSSLFAEEGLENTVDPSGKSLSLASGVTFGQADDGVIIIAPSATRFATALPRSETYRNLGLRPDGAASFAVQGSRLEESSDAVALAGTEVLRAISQLHGFVKLSDVPALVAELRLEPSANAADVQSRLQKQLKEAGGKAGQGAGSEASLLRRASVEATGSNGIRLQAPWERAEIDRAAGSLASWLRRLLFQ